MSSSTWQSHEATSARSRTRARALEGQVGFFAQDDGGEATVKSVCMELDASELPSHAPRPRKIITAHGVRTLDEAVNAARSRSGFDFDFLSVQRTDRVDGQKYWVRAVSLGDLAEYPQKSMVLCEREKARRGLLEPQRLTTTREERLQILRTFYKVVEPARTEQQIQTTMEAYETEKQWEALLVKLEKKYGQDVLGCWSRGGHLRKLPQPRSLVTRPPPSFEQFHRSPDVSPSEHTTPLRSSSLRLSSGSTFAPLSTTDFVCAERGLLRVAMRDVQVPDTCQALIQDTMTTSTLGHQTLEITGPPSLVSKVKSKFQNAVNQERRRQADEKNAERERLKREREQALTLVYTPWTNSTSAADLPPRSTTATAPYNLRSSTRQSMAVSGTLGAGQNESSSFAFAQRPSAAATNTLYRTSLEIDADEKELLTMVTGEYNENVPQEVTLHCTDNLQTGGILVSVSGDQRRVEDLKDMIQGIMASAKSPRPPPDDTKPLDVQPELELEPAPEPTQELKLESEPEPESNSEFRIDLPQVAVAASAEVSDRMELETVDPYLRAVATFCRPRGVESGQLDLEAFALSFRDEQTLADLLKQVVDSSQFADMITPQLQQIGFTQYGFFQGHQSTHIRFVIAITPCHCIEPYAVRALKCLGYTGLSR